jgi:hypothetical protein
VLLIGGLVTVASLGGGSNDDDSSSAEIDAASEKTSEAETAADTMIATAPPGEDDASGAPAATLAPAERTEDAGGASETSAASAEADATTVETIDGLYGPAQLDLPDEDALRQWAATASVGGDGTSSCGSVDDEQLGAVTYQGRNVVVTRHPSTGELFVYDAGDCSPVATVPG